MNINFHYFAVKVLTIKAGFEEDDAQLISSYSQFVDDFDTYRYLFFKEVPDYAQYLATKVPLGWIFNPVTTGFNSFFDYARLSVESNQKKILIPFHFITQDPITDKKEDRKEYRVKPVTMAEPSLLQSLLQSACDSYKDTGDREDIIRIGTLMHIFADTYAHQRFSGYWNWENYAYLEDVIDNISLKNITSSYYPNYYYYVPSIGHPNVSTAPDDSNVSFTMLQKYTNAEKFPYKASYSRSNPIEFSKASREILNYLRACLGKEAIDDESWNILSADLNKGFLTDEKETDKLITHWSEIFPDITFSYNKKDLIINSIKAVSSNEDSVMDIDSDEAVISIFNNEYCEKVNAVTLTSVNDDFFQFNVIADNIRKSVDPDFQQDIEFEKYSNELANKEEHAKMKV